MEFYAYPTLAARLVNDGVPLLTDWELIIDKLLWVHRQFLQQSDKDSAPETFVNLLWVLIDQTLMRIEETKGTIFSNFMLRRSVKVNGRQCLGLRTRWDQLAEVFHKMKPMATTAIHGDLLFEHVLYDERENILRLVSPRGNFGKRAGMMGDPRYDVAKLFMCAVGEYDKIQHNKCRVDFSGGADITVEVRPQPEWLPKAFATRFFGTYDARDITAMAGLMYATAAMSAPTVCQQLALYATGLQLLEALA